MRSMIISSHTPEGSPNHCDICGNDLCLEPAMDTCDAPCPSCGHLLWFPCFEMPNHDESPRGTFSVGQEALVFVKVVGERLGPLPLKLEGRLLNLLGRLAQAKRLQPGDDDDLCRLLLVTIWDEVVRQLLSLASPHTHRHWAYKLGAFLRKQCKGMFAKSGT